MCLHWLLFAKSWGPRRGFGARTLFLFTMDESDRAGDLMAFLMSSHSSMPAAPMSAEAEVRASSANSSTGSGRLARTLTPPPVHRHQSFESETTQSLGGPYRRGSTLDSDMGLTPQTATKPPAAMLLQESPVSTPRQTSEDPALQLEIDAVSKKLEAELNMEDKKNKTTQKDEASRMQTQSSNNKEKASKTPLQTQKSTGEEARKPNIFSCVPISSLDLMHGCLSIK